jgi:hypothetical protein
MPFLWGKINSCASFVFCNDLPTDSTGIRPRLLEECLNSNNVSGTCPECGAGIFPDDLFPNQQLRQSVIAFRSRGTVGASTSSDVPAETLSSPPSPAAPPSGPPSQDVPTQDLVVSSTTNPSSGSIPRGPMPMEGMRPDLAFHPMAPFGQMPPHMLPPGMMPPGMLPPGMMHPGMPHGMFLPQRGYFPPFPRGAMPPESDPM